MSWGGRSWAKGMAWGAAGASPVAPASVATSNAEALSLRDAILGVDIMFNDNDFHVTSAGDFIILSGKKALKQAIYHRLMTRPGEFKVRPSYGVGLFSYVKKRLRQGDLSELKARIIDQLSLEPRIEEVVDVFVEILSTNDGVKIGIKIKAAGEEFEMRTIAFADSLEDIGLKS